MKNSFWALCLVAGFLFPAYNNNVFAAETQEVCKDKVGKDGKPLLDKKGKPQQECRKVKVHKKLEGTEVPEKKK